MDTTIEKPVLNVLIVEDDDAAAHLIQMNLKRAGLDAHFIRLKDGEQLLNLLDGKLPESKSLNNNYLLMLLDIRMPKVDGILALKKIKSSENLRAIPVIMLTTSDRPKEVEACYRLGCSFYIKKQVDYSKFVKAIQNMAGFIATCELPIFGEREHDRES